MINVLLVDDSPLTRAAIRRVINMINDIEVENIYEASNGSQALEIMQVNKIDLVLADLNMPEMTGVEMVEVMKNNQSISSIPVIVVSTESSTARIKQLLAQGVSNYLHKPFTPEQFRSILAETLGGVI